MKKAVILFSGGLDSTTCLAYAKSQAFDCYALSFHYHQRHAIELNAAKKLTAAWGVTHRIFNVDLQQFGGSALTDSQQEIPAYEAGSSDIPNTYVPARNTIFLAIALGFAEVIQAKDIFIGVSHVDYSNYPDCRPEFIASFEKLANIATKMGTEESDIRIHTPLLHLSKAQTISLGMTLGIDYANTISCYQPNEKGHACGWCHSCMLRKKGFSEAAAIDPTVYVQGR
ncbi:MAG TPA: 7-cyano-7-deazaguanine synthase QueC [Gammaproteobacteria bacterium]|jgi:7-cyano-7-deazaguanine synthase|nr:7-cyano-7-deazaguanine synthase QueC [Gammaproteobacteria bacterium]